ncbi:homocysteine biosynthesis protein [bacterium]|nr:homocysteine biosynthesis protein [bacterium]
MKSFDEINERIKQGKAVVLTAEEVIPLAKEKGIKEVAEKVDVVTTATFGPMCSSGVFLNFGHSDPPIKMNRVLLNDVPAYAGLAAVDVYLGASALSEKEGAFYGGGHVIEELVAKKRIMLRAMGCKTDCYPLEHIETTITIDTINQAILCNPRNVYQNYAAATNSSQRTLYTYMGSLLPRFGNVAYSTSGQLSPLINDPEYRTIGIGTRIFLGGGTGYIIGEGTQHNPGQLKDQNGVPLGPAGTLCVKGDLKQMSARYLRGARIKGYGVSLFVGIGIPIPILDEAMAEAVTISDERIYTSIYDYGIPRRSRPSYGRINYHQLRSGYIKLDDKTVPTNPVSSYAMAREIAAILKDWISNGDFFLIQPVQQLPKDVLLKPMDQNI